MPGANRRKGDDAIDSYMHPEGGEVEPSVEDLGNLGHVLILHGRDAGSVYIFRQSPQSLIDLGQRIFELGRRRLLETEHLRRGIADDLTTRDLPSLLG